MAEYVWKLILGLNRQMMRQGNFIYIALYNVTLAAHCIIIYEIKKRMMMELTTFLCVSGEMCAVLATEGGTGSHF